MATKNDAQKVRKIVHDAGGRIVGRTRLQKIAFFLDLAGVGEGFVFSYRHYGPFSEELADGVHLAGILGLITEKLYNATWGGKYSEFSVQAFDSQTVDPVREKLLQIMVSADPIQLELAATAALLAAEGESDPWSETKRRKPEKVGPEDARLKDAKKLYNELLQAAPSSLLPKIPICS